jgi:hypothetical protein
MMVAALLAAACTSSRRAPSTEKLYFSLEIRQEGKVVASPKLLGQTDKVAFVERRQPGAATPDYRLRLLPTWQRDHFQIALDLALREAEGHWDVKMVHGESRQLQSAKNPDNLQISLLVMKVNSPEFRALMGLADRDAAGRVPYSI